MAPAPRETLLHRAEVWSQPAWIANDFSFANGFDPSPASPADETVCAYIYDPPTKPTGFNPKFRCLSADKRKLKVKYGSTNGEVYGEVLATRLMRALGFYADQMTFMPKTTCKGCGPNPFKQTAPEPTTTSFEPTAIETKFEATEIVKQTPINPNQARRSPGWGFEELSFIPNQTHAEALTLLAIFINHLDNRKANQRLACIGKATATDCLGKVVMMIQDVGSTFGGGMNPKLGDLDKVVLETWVAQPIWSQPETCTASVSYWGSQNLSSAKISEDGRQFFLKLMNGFIADRSRVERLFENVQIENRGAHSASEWAEAFIKKVREIENVNPCPTKAARVHPN